MNDYQGTLGQQFARGADVRPGARNRTNVSLRPGPETVVPVTREITEQIVALLPESMRAMTDSQIDELILLRQRQEELIKTKLGDPNMGGKKVKKGADDGDD